MTVTATDTPALVLISENGLPGENGTNGIDGSGFNNVRKSLIDNPLSWLYTKNNIVRILSQLLSVSRVATGNYTDIYGQAQTADPDTPMQEGDGWLIGNTETHTFDVFNNIPLLDNGFSTLLRLGDYAEGSVSQKIFTVDGTVGDLFSIGTDSSGNWVATILGSDSIEYSATTTISATSTSSQTVIATYENGTINLYINDVLEGTVTTLTGLSSSLLLTGNVTVAGDFTLNIQDLRFNDIIFNADEITYLS